MNIHLQLLDAMDLPDKPHLIGFSMGGWMASELAGIAPERLDKVVLVAQAGLNDLADPATGLQRSRRRICLPIWRMTRRWR
jgi:pimeloyl-ACP methyl ester carboxylesterase